MLVLKILVFYLESSGVEELQNSCVNALVAALLLGRSSYNHQSTNKTTTTTTSINDGRARFEKRSVRRGIFVERSEFSENIGVRGNQPLGVGKCMAYRNVEGSECFESIADTTATTSPTQRQRRDNDNDDDNASTTSVNVPWRVAAKRSLQHVITHTHTHTHTNKRTTFAETCARAYTDTHTIPNRNVSKHT